MDSLDLTFFDTGEAQHVFLNTGENNEWVYKIPAAFGYILPFDFSIGKYVLPWFRPKSLFQRLMRFIFIKSVHYLSVKTSFKEKIYFIEDDKSYSSIIFKIAKRLILFYKGFGEAIIPFFHKKESTKSFKKMLLVLDYLAKHPTSDAILPYKIIRDGKAILRIGNKNIPYQGPIIIQKKADFVFTNIKNFKLDTFEWNRLVEIQHLLWKCGTAFLSSGEIIGPKNWALLRGKIYICDTSSMTRDFDRAFNALSKENLDKKEKAVLEILEREQLFNLVEDSKKYFQFIRNEINQDKFIKLWNINNRSQIKSKNYRQLLIKLIRNGSKL